MKIFGFLYTFRQTNPLTATSALTQVDPSTENQVVVVDLASAPNVVRKIAGKLDYGRPE